MSDRPTAGLTAAEVAERVRAGLVNRAPRSDLLDYVRIVRRNLFTLFNAMVVPAAIALFVLGEYPGAIAVSSMAIVNSTIGLAQEIRAKWHLDKLALLVEPKARVLRDGEIREIATGDVVRDDVICLAAGETVVADGPVLESRSLEIDEALLTGESDPVRHGEWEQLLSGSVCVAGEGMYRADRVGAQAFAHSIAMKARGYRYTSSPLTQAINRVIEILTATAIGLCLLYVLLYFVRGLEVNEFVKMVAATITSMVPQGLVLTATISFTLGAVRMSSRGAVVQRLNAVETMAAVDVVCTDKTGTLTTNRLRLARIVALSGEPEQQVRDKLRLFSSATTDRKNKSIEAIRSEVGAVEVALVDQIPFKSQNRYSAVHIRAASGEYTLVLGACEALRGHLASDSENWEPAWKEMLPTGLRILMFAEGEAGRPLGEMLEGMALRPLALVALSDELRPDAGAVLEALAAQGIAFKVISGDNPETVRAAVGGLNLPLARESVISGDQLEQGDSAELIMNHSVFGRIAPEQKVLIVRSLQERGRHVAMIGDGVNDLLPIKKADLGIAMGDGAQATKTVAGLVLEHNNFALLPETLEEGRTIVRNLRRAAKLFLTKNVYSFFLILAYSLGLFGLPFPYLPQQVTLLNWLVIGIPAFVIALSRERSTAATRPRFLREVGWFAIRTGVIFAIAGLTILVLAAHFWPNDEDVFPGGEELTQRTMLLSVLILLGITALLRSLRDGEPVQLEGDNRFRLLAILAVPAYLIAMYWPPSARFFQLDGLSVNQWLTVIAVALGAYGLTLLSDRIRI